MNQNTDTTNMFAFRWQHELSTILEYTKPVKNVDDKVLVCAIYNPYHTKCKRLRCIKSRRLKTVYRFGLVNVMRSPLHKLQTPH